MPADLELEERIRRVGEAYPDAVPPTPELERRILARIAITPGEVAPRPTLRRDLTLAAAFVLFVGTVALGVSYIKAGQQPAHEGPVPASPSPTAAVPTPTPLPPVPAADLAAAQMTNVGSLVTPLNVSATDSGHTITIIGAYADPARIVLFFRVEPKGGTPNFMIYDDYGFINAGGSGFGVTPTDSVSILDGGPRPGTKGIAHLAISVTSLMDFRASRVVKGKWSLAIALRVQPSIPIAAPQQFQLGRWRGNIEIFEVTPTVVHLQAVINGASVPEIGLNTVTLIDPAGKTIGQGCGASITVPKAAINSPSSPLYHNARVYCEFARPLSPGTYHMRFQGGGGVYVLPLTIDALPPNP
jgi:hypothetical protein